MRQRRVQLINIAMACTLVLLSVFIYHWLNIELDKYTNSAYATFRDVHREELQKMRDSILSKNSVPDTTPSRADDKISPVNVLFAYSSGKADSIHGSKTKLLDPLDCDKLGELSTHTLAKLDSSIQANEIDSSTYAQRIQTISAMLKKKGLENTYTIFSKDTCSICIDAFNLLRVEQMNKNLSYGSSFNFPKTQLLKGIIPQISLSVLLLSIVSSAFLLLKLIIREKTKSLELKESFVSNMTHELRTPITTISVALNTLQKEPFDNNIADYISTSIKELDRLSLLVDGVLKLSQFENNELELQMKKIDIKFLFEDVAHKMSPVLREKKASINYKGSQREVYVLADHTHLSNVFYNLIDNSLKYSFDTLRIDYQFSVENNQVVFTYTDNGKGIPEKYLGKVFERFYRAPTEGVSSIIKGNGLGLSYVKEIIERMGGSIVISSQENVGTTLIIKLTNLFSHE